MNKEDNNNNNPLEKKEIRLVDIAIVDENTALNVIVNFLTLAHKRGVFGIDESAKIWECIKMFQKPIGQEQVIN
jgi:hypothetical protein